MNHDGDQTITDVSHRGRPGNLLQVHAAADSARWRCHTRSSTPIAANSILMSTFLFWRHFPTGAAWLAVQDTEQTAPRRT
jgi:hypothetical protein